MRGRVLGIGAIALAISLFLGGCARKGTPAGEANGKEGVPETAYFEFLDDAGWTSWKDNALDDLHAVINLPLKRVTEEDDLEGGQGGIVLNEGGCIRYKNHLKSGDKGNWSGINGIARDGGEFSLRLEIEPEATGFQVNKMGPVSGGAGYVACRETYGKDSEVLERWLYELDESFQKVRGVQALPEVSESITGLAGDADKNWHAIYVRRNGTYEYRVISPEGETIFERTVDKGLSASLCTYGNGRVALRTCLYSGAVLDFRFYEADLGEGELRELAASKDETVRKRMTDSSNVVNDATPVDEYGLVWSARDGMHLYDAREGTDALLYVWASHGIEESSSVYMLTVMENGRVAFMRHEGDGQNYVLLEATEVKKDVEKITLAASPENANYYRRAAASFNRRHPQYLIVVACDYDETGLLTRLGAGDGPVLIDTAVTGFEELEGLWQPLDGFLEQTGLADEMIPQALEFGKIGGVTCGLSTSFTIKTLITADPELSDWDYEGFLKAMEERSGAPFTYQYLYGPTDWREEFFEVFRNGLSNTYYLDAESGETIFGTKRFDRLLKVSEKARACPAWDDGRAVLEGDAVCETCLIMFLQDAVALRGRLEATGERVAGYPTKDGSRNLLIANSPIAIRRTATEEEKRIAYTFLKDMFSSEVMKEMAVSGFGVRLDSLEQAFADYETSVGMDKRAGTYDPTFTPELKEGDREFLMELISGGTVKKSFPAALESVFDEEFGAYLKGGIDGKTLSEHLKSRVWLYLEESK